MSRHEAGREPEMRGAPFHELGPVAVGEVIHAETTKASR
jgi:hypothetical protein